MSLLLLVGLAGHSLGSGPCASLVRHIRVSIYLYIYMYTCGGVITECWAEVQLLLSFLLVGYSF